MCAFSSENAQNSVNLLIFYFIFCILFTKGRIILSADLHCHTRLSNGSLGIEDLIALARNRKVSTIAITDLDCLAGTVRGKIIGERAGIKVITGVELSATDKTNNQEIHLICYLPDFPDRLEGLCSKNSQLRKRSSHFMMLKVAQRYPITSEFVAKCASGSTNIYKVHIMQALIENGFTDKIYSDLYDELFNPDRENSVNHSPEYDDVFSVLTAIHDAGGIAVLTHPLRSKNPELLDKLVEAGLDGIEVYTPNMTAEQKADLIKYAKAHKLLTTGGTNFKGLYNKHVLSVGDCDLPEECINDLLAYKARQKKAQRKAAQTKANEQLKEAVNNSK